MKKLPIFSILSLSPFLIVYLLSLTPWWPLEASPEIPRVVKVLNIPADSQEVIHKIDFNVLPLAVSSDQVENLAELHDAALQSRLDAIIKSNAKWASLSGNKTLNIGVVDLSDPMHAKFAAINPDNMVYAASLPKIAVLLAGQDAIAQGKISPTPEVKSDMRMMIAKSSNSAATRMINRVGLKEIGEIMKKYHLYDINHGGGLWVGKAYGGSNGRIGDPLKNISHAASVFQVCNYYYKLAFGQLVSPQHSKEMLDMLVDPELHHKFVSVLDRVAPEAKVYRKSGTWSTYHTDSALVWDADRKYIVVALADDAGGEAMLRELMLKIDKALVSKA